MGPPATTNETAEAAGEEEAMLLLLELKLELEPEEETEATKAPSCAASMIASATRLGSRSNTPMSDARSSAADETAAAKF